MITRNDVDRDRAAHRLIPGQGYRRAFKLAIPAQPIAPPSECEPVHGTEDLSVHNLNPPVERGSSPMAFVWHASRREWEPVGRVAKRVAFESVYLAAHGWTYGGPT